MRFNIFKLGIFLLVITTLLSSSSGCDNADVPPVSSSGVAKATTKVSTDLAGHTTEQNNIIRRYEIDNKPGAIKHLYVISDYSGDCLLYSTVKGKVTSSGKRLSPISVATGYGDTWSRGIQVDINGESYRTGEVTQDDGTYGSSVEYIYWFDVRNGYHHIYPTGGTTIVVSEQPIVFKHIIVNFEQTNN